MAAPTLTTSCGVAGGGPAGMMLGFLLARAGIDVVVLEKHADFLRDFRGDTIHPSTLELMHELGLLEEFLKQPHQKLQQLVGQIGDQRITLGDFSSLSTRCNFVALMPQWDFLNFLAAQGRRFKGFHLRMRSEAIDLIRDGERVVGVRAVEEGAGPPIEIRADLVVAADGRHSTLRERAGFKVIDLGAPMDVLWLRISRRPEDGEQTFGHIEAGMFMIMLNRDDYWQCAFVVAKGAAETWRKRDIGEFRRAVLSLSPFLSERINEIGSWDDVKLLTVTVNRLPQWHQEGLLCIGDAAHAMSPIGGVGVNLAVQDAVAAANILAAPLAEHRLARDHLKAVQDRREWPTRVTQRIQIFVQDYVIGPVLAGTQRPKPPRAAKLLEWFPALRRIPARVIGIGVRPEHVRTAEARASSN
jgi:2-polyprenyl-6-methoxyphenol hydroxylase-like FAD-dependent oxidoreductase